MMKLMIMTNSKILVANFQGISIRRSLIKLTTRPPLLRTVEFYLIYYEAYCKWLNILDVSSGKAIKLSVQKVHARKRCINSEANYSSMSDKVLYGISELGYHADTTVAGYNCCILQYTGKQCDVSPYHEEYEAIKCVPIVHAETDWKSPETGQTYILVLHEALCMGDMLDHTLVNSNQLHRFGTQFQDKPMSKSPLSIITEDGQFIM